MHQRMMILLTLEWHHLDGFLGYRSGTVNSNTVNSKFHLIRSFFRNFGKNPIISCLKYMVNSNTVNLNFHKGNLTGV